MPLDFLRHTFCIFSDSHSFILLLIAYIHKQERVNTLKRFSEDKCPAIVFSNTLFNIFIVIIFSIMSINRFEESIPLSLANEDSDSDHYSEPSLTGRRRCLPGQPPASPSVFKSSLSIVLSFIFGAAMSTALIAQITQRKVDSDLDRQCAMRMSHYCELSIIKSSPFFLSYPVLPLGRIMMGRKFAIADSRMRKAPVLNEVDIKYSTTTFNGSFRQETVYRRFGSPEVDSAWEALGIKCTYNFIGPYSSHRTFR
jgi:hypothetical protein